MSNVNFRLSSLAKKASELETNGKGRSIFKDEEDKGRGLVTSRRNIAIFGEFICPNVISPMIEFTL